jgi:putative membrane protein
VIPPPPEAGAVRTAIGGALMGIANIIPGVSGGTMILATGLYENFVEAVADITSLRWRLRSWRFVITLGCAAVVAIGASVFPIRWGLDHIHHLMFGLFIGLTLGGVPLLWREMRPVRASGIAATVAGVALMAFIAFALTRTPLPETWLTFLVAGFIASAAMVLPGISGSYLLLIFGLYSPLTTAIKEFIEALRSVDVGAAVSIGLRVIFPIGIGVLLGIGGLTNVLRALLKRYHQATLGFLLGLLLGSVLGLYPFAPLQEKGEIIAPARELTPLNIALVLAAVVLGFLATFAVSRMGNRPSAE